MGRAALSLAYPFLFFRQAKKIKTIFKPGIKMKKTTNESIRNKKVTVRFSKTELESIISKSKSSNQRVALYCREMAVHGFVFEKNNSADLNEVRLLRNQLLEYKTNFSRVSNLIRITSPLLFKEIETTITLIKSALNKYQI